MLSSLIRCAGRGWALQPLPGITVRAFACTVSVSPTLKITQQPLTPASQVNLTCQVQKFYPKALQLNWLENGNLSRTDKPEHFTDNRDGTYNYTSLFLVNSSAHREDVVFTCQVEHDSQPAITENHTVRAFAHSSSGGSMETIPDNNAYYNWNVFIGVGVACALLVVLLMAALYLLRIKQKKGEWNLCFLSGLSSRDGPWVLKYT